MLILGVSILCWKKTAMRDMKIKSYLEVYKTVSEYMNYYNNRYRHGSIGDIPSAEYYEKINNNEVNLTLFVA